MSTATISMPTAAPRNSTGRAFAVFARELRYEFVRLLRTRTFSLSVIGFPVMFYVLFGLLINHGEQNGVSIAKYMLGGYAVFGLVGSALFGIGVSVAADLSAGWLELKRASPMNPIAYLAAKCCTAMAFGVLIVCLLTVLGIVFGHASLSVTEFAKMLALTVVGAVPFAALGLVIALLVPLNSAPGVANLIYLPMSFCSGLWIPLHQLPSGLQKIAPLLPTYHLSQLMLGIFGYASDTHTVTSHWVGLAIFTLLAMAVAAIAFRRREQNS